MTQSCAGHFLCFWTPPPWVHPQLGFWQETSSSGLESLSQQADPLALGPHVFHPPLLTGPKTFLSLLIKILCIPRGPFLRPLHTEKCPYVSWMEVPASPWSCLLHPSGDTPGTLRVMTCAHCCLHPELMSTRTQVLCTRVSQNTDSEVHFQKEKVAKWKTHTIERDCNDAWLQERKKVKGKNSFKKECIYMYINKIFIQT